MPETPVTKKQADSMDLETATTWRDVTLQAIESSSHKALEDEEEPQITKDVSDICRYAESLNVLQARINELS